MLQALRERRCVEDAQENAWKTRAKIWVDAQVGSEACLVRNQAEAENGNWIEIHFENSATQTWKTDHSRTYCCFKSRAPHDRPADLVSRSKHQFIPALLQHPRGWPTLFFTGNHRNLGLLTSSTSNRWNQIFLSWTKRSITKSTRRAWDSGRFQEWFPQSHEDLRQVNKPKPKKERYQNKVLCQSANVLAMRIWKKKFWLWRDRDSKKEAGKKKAQSERSRKFKAHQIKPKSPIARPKEIAKKAARSASWCASVKAAETEALIHPFSKIIREGTNCILLWPMWPINYNTSTQTVIFLRYFMDIKPKYSHGGNPFWAQKKATQDFSIQYKRRILGGDLL